MSQVPEDRQGRAKSPSLARLESIAKKHPENPLKSLQRSGKGVVPKSAGNDRSLTSLFTHAQRRVAAAIAHRGRATQQKSSSGRSMSSRPLTASMPNVNTASPSLPRAVGLAMTGPASSRAVVEESRAAELCQLPPLPTALPKVLPSSVSRGEGRVPALDLAKAGPISTLPLANSACHSNRVLPTGGTLTRSSRRLHLRKSCRTSAGQPTCSSTATRDRSTRANTPSSQRASLSIHGIIGEEGLPSALLPSTTSRDPRRELKEEAQLVGELAFLGDLSCLAKLHHQRELFTQVDRELYRMDEPSFTPQGESLASPRQRRLGPCEVRRPSEWGEVRRLLLTMLGKVSVDKLPIPLLWDMLVPGLEALPIPLLMATDCDTSSVVVEMEMEECPCMQRAEPCLCLSPGEWREAWRGLRRHRSRAREQLSQSSIGNPFADPLLRSVCSGISERLHRMEKQAGGEGEAGLMVMPEGVEEQLVLLGEYVRRAVFPGVCAAQALAAVLPTLVEVKELLKAFHVEVRRQNEVQAVAELRAGSMDSLSPMQSMRTPRPADLYRWRRLVIALSWIASALLECSDDAIMAEGILTTLLDLPVVASQPVTGTTPTESATPFYALLIPVIAAAFFPETVEDSGMWVHPEIEDRRLALDRLRLLKVVSALINIIRRALGSTQDTPPATVYVPMAGRLSSAWAAITEHVAPVVMGSWTASLFAHGTGIIPRFLVSRSSSCQLEGSAVEVLLELRLAEAEAALFSIPADLNGFLLDPHVGCHQQGEGSSAAVGAVEDSLAVAHLGVLASVARGRSAAARKKFYSLRVVEFLCGEIDLEHAVCHMEGRYLQFGTQEGRPTSGEEDMVSTGGSWVDGDHHGEEGGGESSEYYSSDEGRTPAVPQASRKVVVPGLSLTGLGPSTQGCAALLGSMPAEEATRDPVSKAHIDGDGPLPPPVALPPVTVSNKELRKSLSAEPLPPPVSYPECQDVAHERSLMDDTSSSSSTPPSSRAPQFAPTAPSPPIVPRLAFQGLPPSVQGPGGLGIDPTPPEYALGGPDTPVEPPGEVIIWRVRIDSTEGQIPVSSMVDGPYEDGPSSRLSPELFYDCGRRCRRLYRSEELQEGILRLLLLLLLSATRGTLDCRYCDQFPALNRKVNVLFILGVHLSHPANFGALRRLQHHEDMKVVGGGAFGTVFRCETVLQREAAAAAADYDDDDDTEVVAVKLVNRNPNIRDRCVLYDVYNEVTCLEEGRFDDYMTEIYDYGFDGSSYWIVMRFYTMTLTKWRARLGQPLEDHLLDLLETYRKILTAVGKLHRDGLVHYDLKCDNIMVLDHGSARASDISVVLADFGESRVLEGPQNADLCVRNRGTEFVKPPEMLTIERALRRDDAAFDRRKSVGTTTASDVWSVGCMLYELITGQYLFYNDDWIRFYMRLTGGPERAARYGSPAVAAPIDILTDDNIQMLDNNACLCDFLRFMLVRDPQCRPTIPAVLHRFHRVNAAVQLECGVRPHTWRRCPGDERAQQRPSVPCYFSPVFASWDDQVHQTTVP
ncbi:hypothetical protein Pmar_PMAR010052 [Perkinsus marinus ATCC 50983]|uniref:non-specific serine/threonine protein kinase n=1 Tax=Perkinsus marinus (strain ATCC 50983 / TXsc) TaxID=423536 RepID=C5K4P6_PERM5|nr:hypothetical protein Pmar_PMAR010052 [Perkinsus marinus ATCC 50983]EER20318.1 hypothetical protein Pmar_PMAR010052 [Perkinsus marinus ATCC 50983]|eukprot:XP_002788522.1 hypothetical protein Pmar_PMAR010052 [Perkinsus marinus ATCC 50983]